MNRTITVTLLSLYFFCYTIPQFIKGVYYVYDRVSVQILFVSILNLFVLSMILTKRITIPKVVFNNKLHIASYTLFIIFCLISLTSAININESIITLSKFLTYFFSFIFIVILSSSSSINFYKIFMTFALIAIVMETFKINVAVYESVINNGNFLSRSMEFRGFTANINISSFSLAIKFPVLIYLIFTIKNKISRLLLLLLLSSSIFTLFVLSSRAALIIFFLILAVTILYLIIKKTKAYNVRFLYMIASVLLSYSTYGYVNQKNTSDILNERFSRLATPQEDDSIRERITFYKITLNDIITNPLFGIGVGNWKLTSIQRANLEILSDYRVPYHVHNDFLEVTSETGLPGGLSYIYFIFLPFIISLRNIINNKKSELNLMIFLTFGVFIFDSLINFPMHRYVNVSYLFFVIAFIYNQNILQKNED